MIGTIKLYSKYKMCSNVQTKHDPLRRVWQLIFVLVMVGWAHYWIILKLTLGTFGPEHSIVVAFSVSGNFNGEELNPGGWKQERIKKSVAFVSLFKKIK